LYKTDGFDVICTKPFVKKIRNGLRYCAAVCWEFGFLGVRVSYQDIVGFWTNYNLTAQYFSDHNKMIKAISTYFPALTREEK